jgi:hypothetical protein
MSLTDSDFLTTVVAMKINESGSRWYDDNTAASVALAALARMFVFNADLVTTTLTEKSNHQAAFLTREPMLSRTEPVTNTWLLVAVLLSRPPSPAFFQALPTAHTRTCTTAGSGQRLNTNETSRVRPYEGVWHPLGKTLHHFL